MHRRIGLRGVLALLLLVSAALFAVGTGLEHHHAGSAHQEVTTPPSTEGGGESGTDEQPSESASAPAEATGTSETVAGVDLESPWLISAAVLVSVLLAFLAWRVENPALLLLIVTVGLILAVLDVREVVHQVHEGRASLVALSAIVGVLHLGVAVVALIVWRQEHQMAIAPA
jgi:hypothetical protein